MFMAIVRIIPNYAIEFYSLLNFKNCTWVLLVRFGIDEVLPREYINVRVVVLFPREVFCIAGNYDTRAKHCFVTTYLFKS